MTEQSELAAWLEELEAEQAAKALMIASIRQRLGMDPGEPAVAAAPAVGTRAPNTVHAQHHGPLRADTFFSLSTPDAIKKYLGIVKRPQSPRAIADALKQGGVLSQASDFYANVTTALTRLTRSGDVVNTKEGWGLAAWYPNRKPTEVAKPKIKKKKKSGAKTVHPIAAASKPSKAKGATGWHDFLAAYLKEGKSMKVAAADWKLHRAQGS